jgi:hypothetical protein
MTTLNQWPTRSLIGNWSAACGQHGAEPHLYVSPTGSDTTGDGTRGSPWATPEKARAYIRANTLQGTNAFVELLAGNYWSTNLVLDDGDGGTGGRNITYRSTDGPGAAVLCGGTRVTGWTTYSGSISRVNIGAGLTLSTIYENGVRATKARYPKYVPSSTYDTARDTYLTSTGVDTSHTVLQYGVGDLNPAAWASTTDMQVVVWSGGGIAWFTDTIPVSSINTGTRQITLSQNSRYSLFATPTGSRYFVQGVLELLTQAGEFHYDSTSGYLYYWPRDGAIAAQTIVRPTTKRVVSFTGTGTSARCSHVTFDGLGVQYSDFAPWYRHASVNDNDRGGGAYDRQYTLSEAQYGAMYFENTDNITVTNCHIKNVGFSGVFKKGYNQSNTISNCWIEHVGHSGIYADGNYPGTTDVLKSNTYTNLRINNCGELAGSGGGIYMLQSGSNTISYCDISKAPRLGILLGAYTGFAAAQIYTASNLIDHVKVSRVCQDSGDVGGIYIGFLSSVSGGPYKVNTLNQVIIDTIAASASMPDAAGNGLFFDDESWNQVASNVNITNTAGAAEREHNTGGMTFTNVSWTGVFTGVDTANIGVTSSFPSFP